MSFNDWLGTLCTGDNNLVKNALKFTEQGNVRIGNRRLSNDSFYFYVADTGCGIDEESRRAIFERFCEDEL